MLCMHYHRVSPPSHSSHERVRLWREAYGWSQAQLAEETGMPQSKISRIETGDTAARADEIEQIATAFGLTMVQFYGAVRRREARAS